MRFLNDDEIEFFTDAATLAIFDPAILSQRVNDEIDWWCGEFNDIAEVQSGEIALLSLSDDGHYKIRVAQCATLSAGAHPLYENYEKDFARSVIGPLGVESVSGKVFIGKGECLPGGGNSSSQMDISAEDGKFIDLPVGRYNVFFYYINSQGYADLPNRVDIVIFISKREGEFVGVQNEPRIDPLEQSFLFPTRKRKASKPKLNIELNAKVWKSPKTPSGLAIVADYPYWPKSYIKYDVVLEDMSQVKWKDRIIFKAKRVDVQNKIIYAELIQKLS